MSVIDPRAYVFSSVFIGNAPPATAVLTRVNNVRTNGVPISEQTPTAYISWLDEQVMTGERVVKVVLTFYDKSTTSIPVLMARGISISGTFGDITNFQFYSLFLVSPVETNSESFYFPKLRSEIDWNSAYVKDDGVVVPVTLTISAPNITTELVKRGTVAEIVSALGARSPI